MVKLNGFHRQQPGKALCKHHIHRRIDAVALRNFPFTEVLSGYHQGIAVIVTHRISQPFVVRQVTMGLVYLHDRAS